MIRIGYVQKSKYIIFKRIINILIYSCIELWHKLCIIPGMEPTVFYYILLIYVDGGEEEAV